MPPLSCHIVSPFSKQVRLLVSLFSVTVRSPKSTPAFAISIPVRDAHNVFLLAYRPRGRGSDAPALSPLETADASVSRPIRPQSETGHDRHRGRPCQRQETSPFLQAIADTATVFYQRGTVCKASSLSKDKRPSHRRLSAYGREPKPPQAQSPPVSSKTKKRASLPCRIQLTCAF